MKKISLSDLSKALGVSKTTISLVLNNKGDQYGIKEEVQVMIKEKAIELKYKPNQTARNLRCGKSNTIGVVVDDLTNGFQSKLLQHIENKAKSIGYSIIVTTTSSDTFVSTLMNRNVDGIILNTSINHPEVERIYKNNFPVVSVRGNKYNKNFVGLNYKSIIEHDCDYLIGKGHQDVAIAFENSSSEHLMKEALKGAKKSFVKNSIPLENIIALSIDGQDGSEVSNVIKEVKANNPDLRAVISVSDILTIKLIESFSEMGLSIPGDMSLLSLFDHELFAFTFPKISANKTPYDLMAESIMETLIGQVSGKEDNGKEIQLISTLIERASA